MMAEESSNQRTRRFSEYSSVYDTICADMMPNSSQGGRVELVRDPLPYPAKDATTDSTSNRRGGTTSMGDPQLVSPAKPTDLHTPTQVFHHQSGIGGRSRSLSATASTLTSPLGASPTFLPHRLVSYGMRLCGLVVEEQEVDDIVKARYRGRHIRREDFLSLCDSSWQSAQHPQDTSNTSSDKEWSDGGEKPSNESPLPRETSPLGAENTDHSSSAVVVAEVPGIEACTFTENGIPTPPINFLLPFPSLRHKQTTVALDACDPKTRKSSPTKKQSEGAGKYRGGSHTTTHGKSSIHSAAQELINVFKSFDPLETGSISVEVFASILGRWPNKEGLLLSQGARTAVALSQTLATSKPQPSEFLPSSPPPSSTRSRSHSHLNVYPTASRRPLSSPLASPTSPSVSRQHIVSALMIGDPTHSGKVDYIQYVNTLTYLIAEGNGMSFHDYAKLAAKVLTMLSPHEDEARARIVQEEEGAWAELLRLRNKFLETLRQRAAERATVLLDESSERRSIITVEANERPKMIYVFYSEALILVEKAEYLSRAEIEAARFRQTLQLSEIFVLQKAELDQREVIANTARREYDSATDRLHCSLQLARIDQDEANRRSQLTEEFLDSIASLHQWFRGGMEAIACEKAIEDLLAEENRQRRAIEDEAKTTLQQDLVVKFQRAKELLQFAEEEATQRAKLSQNGIDLLTELFNQAYNELKIAERQKIAASLLADEEHNRWDIEDEAEDALSSILARMAAVKMVTEESVPVTDFSAILDELLCEEEDGRLDILDEADNELTPILLGMATSLKVLEEREEVINPPILTAFAKIEDEARMDLEDEEEAALNRLLIMMASLKVITTEKAFDEKQLQLFTALHEAEEDARMDLEDEADVEQSKLLLRMAVFREGKSTQNVVAPNTSATVGASYPRQKDSRADMPVHSKVYHNVPPTLSSNDDEASDESDTDSLVLQGSFAGSTIASIVQARELRKGQTTPKIHLVLNSPPLTPLRAEGNGSGSVAGTPRSPAGILRSSSNRGTPTSSNGHPVDGNSLFARKPSKRVTIVEDKTQSVLAPSATSVPPHESNIESLRLPSNNSSFHPTTDTAFVNSPHATSEAADNSKSTANSSTSSRYYRSLEEEEANARADIEDEMEEVLGRILLSMASMRVAEFHSVDVIEKGKQRKFLNAELGARYAIEDDEEDEFAKIQLRFSVLRTAVEAKEVPVDLLCEVIGCTRPELVRSNLRKIVPPTAEFIEANYYLVLPPRNSSETAAAMTKRLGIPLSVFKEENPSLFIGSHSNANVGNQLIHSSQKVVVQVSSMGQLLEQ